MKRRIILVIVIFLIMFSIILIRLNYIGFIMVHKIEDLAYDLWSRDIPINSNRGIIYDKNGNELVTNELAISVCSINRQINDKHDTAKKLSKVLDCSYESIYNHIIKNNSIEIIKPEGRRINYDKALEIVGLKLDGIYIVSDSKRYYKYGDALAPLIGFCGIDNDGLSGIEYKYNEYLKPQKGKLRIYTDARGNLMNDLVSEYIDPLGGMDLYLTLDKNIVLIVDNIIKKSVLKYNPDRMMALVMDVSDGSILTMSSYPSFDPSNYKEYSEEVYNRNLPIFYDYEPGSIFKMFTYSVGLELGLFDLDDKFYCPGYRVVGDRKIRCWKSGGHKDETALSCIENSCNPFFMYLVEKIGSENFYKYLDLFEFGKKTGVDLSGEASGIILNKKYANSVELACMSFGQTNTLTQIQQCIMGIATTTSYLVKPYILDKILVDNEIVFQNRKNIKNKVLSDKTTNIMRYALESVVARGTGRNAFYEGRRIGGKTSTSQKVVNGRYGNEYILSFMGIAPINDPKIVTLISIDNPKNTVNYGGVVAAPLVGEAVDMILEYLNVEADYDNQINKELRWMIDSPTYKVDNYVGMNIKDITNKEIYNYVIYGNGDKVIYQAPKAGEKVKEGDSIMLYVG